MWIRSTQPFETASYHVREAGVLLDFEETLARELIAAGKAVEVKADAAKAEKYGRASAEPSREQATANPGTKRGPGRPRRDNATSDTDSADGLDDLVG